MIKKYFNIDCCILTQNDREEANVIKKRIILLMAMLVLFTLVLPGMGIANSDADTETEFKNLLDVSTVLLVGCSDAYVDGHKVKIDSSSDDVYPRILNGKTILPVRFISENTGAKVTVNLPEVEVVLNDKTVKLTIGSKKILVNNSESQLEVPAQIINGRTFIPLRPLVESLGKKLFWDNRGLIIISDKPVITDTSQQEVIIQKIISMFKTYSYKGKKIKVGMDACYKPMGWESSSEIVGFDVDLIKAISKEIDADIEIRNISWDDIFDKLYTKEIDLIVSSVSITNDRKKTMLFSDSYFEWTNLIIMKKNANFSSINDLRNKRVGVQAYTISKDLVKSVPNVKLTQFEDFGEALIAFKNGKVDYVIGDSIVILDFAKEYKSLGYKVFKDKSFPVEQFGMVANIGDDVLINDINNALRRIKAMGEYQRIYDNYFRIK